jgi:ABC-type lipoprotein release transport system permease subunit
VTGRDPLICAAVAPLVAAVSLVATFMPARRATRVDPMHGRRME